MTNFFADRPQVVSTTVVGAASGPGRSGSRFGAPAPEIPTAADGSGARGPSPVLVVQRFAPVGRAQRVKDGAGHALLYLANAAVGHEELDGLAVSRAAETVGRRVDAVGGVPPVARVAPR